MKAKIELAPEGKMNMTMQDVFETIHSPLSETINISRDLGTIHQTITDSVHMISLVTLGLLRTCASFP